MRFEIYTYFGRVLWTVYIGKDELHHHALERARKLASRCNHVTWIRLKGAR